MLHIMACLLFVASVMTIFGTRRLERGFGTFQQVQWSQHGLQEGDLLLTNEPHLIAEVYVANENVVTFLVYPVWAAGP